MAWGTSREVLVLVALGGCRFDPDVVGGEHAFPTDGRASADTAPAGDGAADAPADARLPPDAYACPGGSAPNHVGELSEGIQRWAAIYETPVVGPMPAAVTVDTDPAGAQVGDVSIRLDCSTDRCSLVYPADLNAGWDLSGFDVVELTMTALNANANGWQEAGPQIRLYTSISDYRTLRPIINIVPRVNLVWVEARVPLAGGDGWTASDTGAFDPRHVNALQIRQDTWDTGYIFWADGVTFGPGTFHDCAP